MSTFITIVHCFSCLLLITLVLIQSGKGAEISASFGGSSQTVFGASGGATFFTKLTYGMASVFMATSLILTVLSARDQRSVMEGAPIPAAAASAATAPAAPQSAAPAAPTAAPAAPKK